MDQAAPHLQMAIVRHGKAEAHAESGHDRDRRLRPRGERQAVWLGERLAAAGFRPGLILSSPYERAITTARLINESLGAPLEIEGALACDEPASRALALIEGHAGRSALMIVGHNPQLSRLIAVLLDPASRRAGEMQTGMAALLRVEAPPAGGLAQSARLSELLRMPGED